jgi:hypothetical protein
LTSGSETIINSDCIFDCEDPMEAVEQKSGPNPNPVQTSAPAPIGAPSFGASIARIQTHLRCIVKLGTVY